MSQRDDDPLPQAEAAAHGASRWTERLCHRLVHHAALAAPASLSERLAEEWLADLQQRPSPGSRLRFALGCCWATRVIAYEHRASVVAVASAGVGTKLAIHDGGNDAGLLSRRSIIFLLVVCLHIVLFYGLMTGLAYKIIKVMPSSLQTRFVPEAHPRELPPPLPPPTLATRKLEVPIPEFPLVQDPDESVLVAPPPPSNSPTLPQPSPPVTPHEVSRVQGGPGGGFPNPDDYYPSAAKRLEEQGSATVRVCVDARGRLTAAPTTLQSSGNPRLDEGALQLARAGAGHYRPTTEDGRPVDSCYAFRVRFQLKE